MNENLQPEDGPLEKDKRQSNRFYWTVVALMVLGVIARVFAAWCHRNNTDPDSGIVALMAKHMAEGLGFPIFFYGQAYMGTLEPAFSALLCKLFGVSGFMVCMGTAIIGMLLLPLLYIWANEAGGRIAGVAALAYCVLGPQVFYAFQVAPRGGYTLILVLGTLVTLLVCKALAIERSGRRASILLYLVIGLCAGLGWWTNQIIAYALAAVTLLFFVALRRKALSLHIVGPGFAGFFGGSLPLWIWNARNGWKSLSFLKAGGDAGLTDGLETLFTERLLSFMGLANAATYVRVAVLGLLLLLVVMGVLAVRRQGKERKDGKWLFGLSAVLFLLAGSIIFATSRFSAFNTARYLVPLVPPLAVLVGLGTAQLYRRVPPLVAWIPLTLLIAWQCTVLPYRLATERGLAKRMERVQRTGEFLRTENVDALYTPFAHHWLNFALREEFQFSDLKGEKYKPNAIAVEQADDLGIVGDYGHIESFLHLTQARARKDKAGLFSVVHDFTPPPSGLREIQADQIANITDLLGDGLTEKLTDRNIDTYWTTSMNGGAPETLEITFSEPTDVSALRMLGVGADPYPRGVEVLAYDGEWSTLVPKQNRPHYYWSGPRPYWGGERFRLEARFAADAIRTLRIRRLPDQGVNDWQISELQLFGPSEDVRTEREAWPTLYRHLRDSQVNILYGDRWIANKVHVEFDGAIRTPLETRIYGEVGTSVQEPVSFTRYTALLVRVEDAPSCRHVLQRFGIHMREKDLSPWVLFYFDEASWNPSYANVQNVYWLGYTCAIGGAKKLAAHAIRAAYEGMDGDAVDPARVEKLMEAIELEPNMITAVPKLSTWLHRLGRPEEAERVRIRYEQAAVPAIKTPIRFDNGLEFLGLRAEATKVAPGDMIEVTYYWRCPREINATDWAVFVHVDQGKSKFQNDHVLLSNYRQADISYQPFNEIFSQKRRMKVPDDAPEGPYRVRVGVYSRITDKRVRPRSSFDSDNDAVELPFVFTVQPHS